MFINLFIVIGQTFWNAIEYDVLIDRSDEVTGKYALALQDSLVFICGIFGSIAIGFILDYSSSYRLLLTVLFVSLTATYIPAVFSLDRTVSILVVMRCIYSTFNPSCVLYLMAREYLISTQGMTLLTYTMYSTCVNQFAYIVLAIVGALDGIYGTDMAWVISNASIFTVFCIIVLSISFLLPRVVKKEEEAEVMDDNDVGEHWVGRSSRLLRINLKNTYVWMLMNSTHLLFNFEMITFVVYISRGPLGLSLFLLSVVFLCAAVMTVVGCIIFTHYKFPERTWICRFLILILLCSSTFILCVNFAIEDFYQQFVLYAAITNICIQVVCRQIVNNITISNLNNAIQNEQRGKMTTLVLTLSSLLTFGLMQLCTYTYSIRPELPFIIMTICDVLSSIFYYTHHHHNH
jgi:hypothetical protein